MSLSLTPGAPVLVTGASGYIASWLVRYLLVAGEIDMLGIARILRERFGSRYPFPRMTVPKFLVWAVGPLMGPVTRRFIRDNVGYPVRFDNQRSRALGVQYHPMRQTLQEHFQQVLDDGQLKKRRR